MKHSFGRFLSSMAILFLLGCAGQEAELNLPPSPVEGADVVRLEDLAIVAGQTIYVPAYSEIYFGNGRTLDLAITLSARNTDLSRAVVLTSVRYYDNDGRLVKEFLDQPIRLEALASVDFFVEADDTSGGLGANFIVEWVAEQPVSEPVIEAVMLSTISTQGVSFVSLGRVIDQIEAEE